MNGPEVINVLFQFNTTLGKLDRGGYQRFIIILPSVIFGCISDRGK